jgi:hypothetical protein
LRIIIAIPIAGLSQVLGASIIHGIAKGKRRIPDSPESAGFFEATKNIHANTATAENRKIPATMNPLQECLITSFLLAKWLSLFDCQSGDSIQPICLRTHFIQFQRHFANHGAPD